VRPRRLPWKTGEAPDALRLPQVTAVVHGQESERAAPALDQRIDRLDDEEASEVEP